MKVKFFTKYPTERLKYILSFISERIPQLEWELHSSSLPTSEIHVLYGTNFPPTSSSIIIPDETLLTTPTYKTYQHPSASDCKAILQSSIPFSKQLPFDILSFIFFQLSRMEEYTTEGRDLHGRFQAQQSKAFQLDYLSFPIVDIIVQKLGHLLAKDCSIIIPKSLITIDVDVAFAFQHKPIYIQILSLMKDFIRRDFQRIQSRISNFLAKSEDPYDTFDELIDLSTTTCHTFIFFFLVGERSHFDRNISPQRKKMKEVLLKTSQHFEIGVHPSYQSNSNPTLIEDEKNIIEQIIQKKVFKSRQHYLKIALPDTYQHLIKAGIQEDYSMGYPDVHGYRAGTAGSFRWYDLSQEKITDLRIFPFQIMDVSLKKYLEWNPHQALEALEPLYKNRPFTIIWHNSNLSKLEDWLPWKKVFKTLTSWQL